MVQDHVHMFEEAQIRSYIQNQEQLDGKGAEDSGMF